MQDSSKPGHTRRLRIFSANLLHGAADIEALLDSLRTLRVDIAAFQESTRPHAEAIASVLPHGGLGPCGDRSLALALKHPAEISPVTQAGRNAEFARLDPEHWPGVHSPIEIITTHIRAPHLWPPWRTFPQRRVQVNGLAAHIDATPTQPRLLIGDLNATPGWPAYRRLSGLLEDAAQQVASRNQRQPEATWSPRLSGSRLLRIDHALVGGLAVHDFSVVPVAGSDHAGILIEVSLD